MRPDPHATAGTAPVRGDAGPARPAKRHPFCQVPERDCTHEGARLLNELGLKAGNRQVGYGMGGHNPFYVYDPNLRRIMVGTEVVGDISWKVHNDLSFINFKAFPSGFSFFKAQIPELEIMPIQYIADVHVKHEHRRKGYARAAMLLALKEAVAEGAKISFLRVGWGLTDDWEEIKNWLTSWYQTLGFILLENENEGTIIPFLWRSLSEAIPEALPSVSLQKDKEQEGLIRIITVD
jgi:hypothetical protein